MLRPIGNCDAILRTYYGVRCKYDCDTIFIIGAEGGANASLACEGMFDGCSQLMIVDFNDSFHTEGATNMNSMLYGLNPNCRLRLNPDTFVTSNVTNYEDFMHYGDEINGEPWTDLFE